MIRTAFISICFLICSSSSRSQLCAAFVIGIQAFQGSTCGSLTEMGCALAGGPSSGVQLSLTGLQTGQLYYFRIFGSSHSTPQRTALSISDISGRPVKSVVLSPGLHRMSTAALFSGIYAMHSVEDNRTYKFIVSK